VLLTTLAVVAFAASSILCRLALHDPTIDAASFCTIRLLPFEACGTAAHWTASQRHASTPLPLSYAGSAAATAGPPAFCPIIAGSDPLSNHRSPGTTT